jgi:hypothetical protein
LNIHVLDLSAETFRREPDLRTRVPVQPERVSTGCSNTAKPVSILDHYAPEAAVMIDVQRHRVDV